MPSLTFYRQGRLDGGIRTGIEVDRETVLGRFEEGRDEEDPVLAWFIVVEARGDSLPSRAEEAREWFLTHADAVRDALMARAGTLGVGLDVDSWPLRSSTPSKIEGQGIQLTITCAAYRRADGQQLQDRLLDLARRWEENVLALSALEEISM